MEESTENLTSNTEKLNITGHTVQISSIDRLGKKPEQWVNALKDLEQIEGGPRKRRILQHFFMQASKNLDSTEFRHDRDYAMLLGEEALFYGEVDAEDARSSFQLALALCQKSPILYILYAQFELDQGRKHKALKILGHGEVCSSDPSAILAAREKIQKESGRIDGGLRIREKRMSPLRNVTNLSSKLETSRSQVPLNSVESRGLSGSDHSMRESITERTPTLPKQPVPLMPISPPKTPKTPHLLQEKVPSIPTPSLYNTPLQSSIKDLLKMDLKSPDSPNFSTKKIKEPLTSLTSSNLVQSERKQFSTATRSTQSTATESDRSKSARKFSSSHVKSSTEQKPKRVPVRRIDPPRRVLVTESRSAWDSDDDTQGAKPLEEEEKNEGGERPHESRGLAPIDKLLGAKYDKENQQPSGESPNLRNGETSKQFENFSEGNQKLLRDCPRTNGLSHPSSAQNSHKAVWNNQKQGIPLHGAPNTQAHPHAPIQPHPMNGPIHPAVIAHTPHYPHIQPHVNLYPTMRSNPVNKFPQEKVINGVSYMVLKVLGKGGSSKVFQVFNPQTSEISAVKQVNLSGCEPCVLEGYKNEIEFLRKLQGSRYIIKLKDYEICEKYLYLVMECGSTDLSGLLKRRKAEGSELEILDIMLFWRDMLKAVQTIHKHGVIHLDLKPANFMLIDYSLKLIDFGIANSIQVDATSIIKDTQFGTLNYMAPETINDMSGGQGPQHAPKFKVGPKADVWSLGCILYCIMYGRTPFQHIHHQAMKLCAITNEKHKIEFPPFQSENIVEIVQACLTRDPKKRPSVDELLKHHLLKTRRNT